MSDGDIKPPFPYEISYQHRLIDQSAVRMNEDGELLAVQRIDNFAEELWGGKNNVAFGRHPFGAFRLALTRL
ncbi:MAG TPA: hypothetical protein VME69_04855 [Methylocella sp.]|nr:hypothetical protein [Methylocella sp.]